jgi:hypothetical protein
MADRGVRELRREQMEEISKRFLAKLKFEAPKKSGALSDSFSAKTYERGQGLELKVFSSSPYIKAVTKGVNKRIFPRGNVLAMRKQEIIGPFAAKQSMIVYRRWASGQKANPFHEKAVNDFKPEWNALWRRMAVRVVTRLAGK